MINIYQEQFIKLSKESNHIILDVRMPDECASGIIAGAKTMDFMNSELFSQEIKKLDKSKSYLIYCRSGNRSSKACEMMEGIGFASTYNLIGGMMDWKGPIV